MRMKKNLLYILPVLSLGLLLSCNREEMDAPAEGFDLTVRTRIPGWTDEEGTKVTFDGTSLAWVGTEDASLLIGNASGYTASVLTSQTKYPGAFTGHVSTGSYAFTDIKAVATPAACASMESGNLVLEIPATQSQKADGVFEGAPLWRELSSSELVPKDNGIYAVEGLALKWGAAVLQFNVYGSQASQSNNEVLKTIILETEGRTLEGKAKCTLGASSFNFGEGTGRLTVNLAEDVRIAGKTSATGVKVFAVVLPRAEKDNETVKVTRVTVQTDLASYSMNPGKELALKAGQVHRIGLDMSKFPSRNVSATYSTDGGQTWTETLPSSFATLAVKGFLSAATLERIAAAVKVQGATSEVDLSRSEYESNEFPAAFMATNEAPDRRLKSILFPSNITSIAASAFDYCSALESVDLTGITQIGGFAFRSTGLRHVSVPNTVTQMPGQYHFGYCYNLETVYFDAPIPSDGTTHHFFSMRNQGDNPLNSVTYPLVVTLGPHAALSGQEFDTNQKVVKVIFEGSNIALGGCSWLIRCRNIETFDCSTLLTPPSTSSTSTGNLSEIGSLVSGKRRILVPEGSIAAYAAVIPWKYLVENNGYEFEEVHVEYDSKVEWSEDGTNWSRTLPETFTSLMARGELGEADLVTLLNAIRETGLKVSLDLSLSTLGTEPGAIFPAIFRGSSEAPNALLKGIRFPSNVTEIAEAAFTYCEALESVDLTGITTINANAFSHSGLKEVNIPSSVTSMPGQYAFGYCWQLERIYYDSPVSWVDGAANPHTFSCRNTASPADLPAEYQPANLIPLSFTFGPHALELRPQDFDTNHKLVKMTFEKYPEYFGNSWIVRCRYVETFDLSAAPLSPTAKNANTSNLAAVGDLVPAGRPRQILVPAGAGTAFAEVQPWKYLVENKGYVIVDPDPSAGDPDVPVDPETVQYSTDGGTTWVSEIPDAFTSLSVKGSVTAEILNEIKAGIDGQTGGASLDMSASTYVSTTFPAIFGGTTQAGGGSAGADVVATEGSPLTSIKFPSNVKVLATRAFTGCTKLRSVDLTGLTDLGLNAFQATGLTSVTVPASVTVVPKYTFSYCPDLTTIVWKALGIDSNHAFSWRGVASSTKNTRTYAQTATFAAGVNLGSGQCFDTNHRLVKVTLLGDPASIAGAPFIRCTGLSEFDFSACTAAFPDACGTPTSLSAVGDDVPGSEEKRILVPAGLKETFATKPFVQYLVENKGFVIREVE